MTEWIQAIAAAIQTIVVIAALWVTYTQFLSDHAQQKIDKQEREQQMFVSKSERSLELVEKLKSTNIYGNSSEMLNGVYKSVENMSHADRIQFLTEFEQKNKSYLATLELLANCIDSNLCDKKVALTLGCGDYIFFYFTARNITIDPGFPITQAVKKTIEECTSPEYYGRFKAGMTNMDIVKPRWK